MIAKLEKISLLTILLLVLASTSTWASTTYQYDDLHRLKQVERADGTVTVYQYDDFGNRTSMVTAANDTVTALFDTIPSSGPAPLPVTFTDQSIGDITTREWDFDGDDIADSTLPSLSHTYTSPGTYTASLTVSGPAGSSTKTKDIIVQEPQAGPALEVSPLTTSVPVTSGTVSFQVINAGTGTMTWSASSTCSWLQVVEGTAGANDGTITVYHETNTGNARSGSITVTAVGAVGSPQIIQINQASNNAIDVTVIEPTFGDIWNLGTTHDIRWQASAENGIARVRLYLQAPNNTDLIADLSSNPGSYSWDIPSTASSYLTSSAVIKIRVTDNDGADREVQSPVFSIQDDSAAPPAPWNYPEPVLSSMADNDDNGLGAIAVDSQGTVHLVYLNKLDDSAMIDRTITQKIMYRTRSGGIWSDPVELFSLTQVTDAGLTGYRALNDFKIAVDSQDRPHIVWVYGGPKTIFPDASGRNQSEIYYLHYNGTSWEVAVNVSNNSTYSSFASLCVDGNDNVHIAWHDGRTYSSSSYSSTGTAYAYHRIRHADDSWSAAGPIPGSDKGVYCSIAAGTDGMVSLVYVDSVPRLLNQVWDGSQWLAPTVIDQAPGTDFVDFYSNDIAVDADNVAHVVVDEWEPVDSGDYAHRVKYFQLDGTVPPVEEIINGTDDSYSKIPQISLDSVGKPHVVWYQGSAGFPKLLYRHRQSTGWSTAVQINTDGSWPHSEIISADISADDYLHVVWQGSYDGEDEIYYNYAQTSSDTSNPTVSVNAPTANENLYAGTSYSITWTAVDDNGIADISLSYSLDNGQSMVPIADQLANTGQYSWLVPDGVNAQAQIYVIATDLTGNQTTASSDIFNLQTVTNEIFAAFTAEPTSGIAPLTVSFSDLSVGAITAYEWDFDGDGVVDSTQQNPTHIYETSRIYFTTLTTRDSGGNTATASERITVGSNSISGMVTDSSGTPLSNVCVYAYTETCYGSFAGPGVSSDENGYYRISVPAGGDYYLLAVPQCNETLAMLREWLTGSGGTYTCEDAEPVTVIAGQAKTGIDFVFMQPTIISGTVTDNSGIPLANVCVDAYTGTCYGYVDFSSDVSDENGVYQVLLPSGGDYYLRANPACYENLLYREEWWTGSGGSNQCDYAEPVSIVAGQETPGVNFELDQLYVISGTVTNSSGTPLSNIGINVCHEPCQHDCVAFENTDEFGNYTLRIPAGNYYLNTYANFQDLHPVADEWWDGSDGTTDCNLAAILTVSEDIANVNFELADIPDFPAPVIQSSGLVSREKPDGSISTIFYLYMSEASPEDIYSCVADGPSGTFYLYPNFSIRQRGLAYVTAPGFIVDDGTYTFTITDRKGRQVVESEDFTYDSSVPRLDESSRLPENQSYTATTTPTISFASVGEDYYYKVYVNDYNGRAAWYTSTVTQDTSFTIPEGLLQPNTPYQWYVRVFDKGFQANSCQESERFTFYTGDGLTPNLDKKYVIDTVRPGIERSWLGVRNTNIAPWDIDSLTATDPDSNVYDITSYGYYFNRPSVYSLSVASPYPFTEGYYNFNLETTSGMNISSDISFERNPLPVVDESSLLPADNSYLGSDFLTFSWDTLFDESQPDRIYYYRVRVYSYDLRVIWYDSEITTGTSITIPVAGNFAVGSSYRWKLVVYDDLDHNQNIYSSNRRVFTIADAPVKADFTRLLVNSMNFSTFHFIDTSSGNIAKWYWDFGDGFTSTLRNPIHEYTVPGPFDVSLTVEGFYNDTDFQVVTCYDDILDIDGDRDVDGTDLALIANNPSLYDLSQFASEFGVVTH